MYFFKNVLHGFLVYVVDNDFDFVLGYVFILDVLFDKVSSLVRGVIINVHDVIILVILHEEGVEISEVKFGFDVVVRGYKNAEPELGILVLADVIFLFVIRLFELDDILDDFDLLKWIILKRGELNIDISMKVDVMYELGKENGPDVESASHIVRLSSSFVEVVEVGVEDEVAGGDREPVVIWGLVVGESFVGGDQMGDLLNLV
jgi:hypothetical protein